MNEKRFVASRRSILRASLGIGGALLGASLLPEILSSRRAPAVLRAQSLMPQMPYGVASGDILSNQAVLWSKADRPARMIVELATTENMKNARRIVGPAALEDSDFTAKLNVSDLPIGQDIFYRVSFQSLEDVTIFSEPVTGRFRTAPGSKRMVKFLWSGDTAGQGWGINPEWGGMRIYRTMANLEPDFFIHSGDTIYADNPIQTEVKLADNLADNTVWKNVTTEAKSKVAETLQEFRGNFMYNLMDENVRDFNAAVPMIAQWDDHEVIDNWYPNEMLLADDRYTVKSVALLAARANRAFMEYIPIRSGPDAPERIDRVLHYGPSLDVFVIDMRTYRANNGANNQSVRDASTDFLGREQIRRLKQQLLASTATWKVIASDMPIGLIVFDDFRTREGSESLSNGSGPAMGRELEMVDLLRFVKYNDIQNVVWITADVHYTAAHDYDPNKAQFQDFSPFYEFVSGPLNAGTFGPNELDDTFGPQVIYQKTPEAGQFNLPPSAGLQFFGEIRIDGETEVLTATLYDLEGTALFTQKVLPA